jgi:outer membrane protein TolC
LAAQVSAARDRVTLEIDEALRAIRTADNAIVTSSTELENAREAHQAAAALFAEGRVPSALLADAEEDLTRARLELLNARVDARIGRVRLAYALGENTSNVP